MSVDAPNPMNRAEVVFIDHTHEAASRVEVYSRVRAEFSLPPLVSHLLGDRLRLTFDQVPPPANVASLSPAEVPFVLHRLARLEAALGWNLAAVPESAFRFDPMRKIPTLTAGLFTPGGEGPSAVVSLLRALGIQVEHPPHSVQAAAATLVALLPGSGAGDDEATLVRALLDAAAAERAAGRYTAAADSLRNAWSLRPGDGETGQQWVDLANDHGADLPPSVEDALQMLANANPRLLKALARRANLTHDTVRAVERARALTLMAPEEPLGWKILAASAQHDPSSHAFGLAMRGLAQAGDERALLWLWTNLGPEATGSTLDEWAHSWTPVSAGLRLRWLGHQERLRDLLQFYFATCWTVRPLDAAALDAVVAAAARLDRLHALRERMKALLEKGLESALLRAYLAACQLDQVPEAIVDADRCWSGEVPPGPLARALLALGRFDESIRHADIAGLPDISLQALVKRALLQDERAPMAALRATIDRLGRGSEVASGLLVDLHRVSPGAAITAQLRRLIEETA